MILIRVIFLHVEEFNNAFCHEFAFMFDTILSDSRSDIICNKTKRICY